MATGHKHGGSQPRWWLAIKILAVLSLVASMILASIASSMFVFGGEYKDICPPSDPKLSNHTTLVPAYDDSYGTWAGVYHFHVDAFCRWDENWNPDGTCELPLELAGMQFDLTGCAPYACTVPISPEFCDSDPCKQYCMPPVGRTQEKEYDPEELSVAFRLMGASGALAAFSWGVVLGGARQMLLAPFSRPLQQLEC
jgi:hypothetical protein